MRSYFVCATPRTGSSLLLGLLGSTGVAGRPQAYFRTPDEPLWRARWGLGRSGYAEFVRAAIAAGSTGNGVFGAKLMWGTLDELLDRIGGPLEQHFGPARYVYLRREDEVAQAVSWVRAEQTQRWFAGGDGEISGSTGGGREPVYDAAAITGRLRVIRADNAGWLRWFATAGVRPLALTYEELAADPAGATERVLAHLGLVAEHPIVARHQRQADELNQEWITRYRRTS